MCGVSWPGTMARLGADLVSGVDTITMGLGRHPPPGPPLEQSVTLDIFIDIHTCGGENDKVLVVDTSLNIL